MRASDCSAYEDPASLAPRSSVSARAFAIGSLIATLSATTTSTGERARPSAGNCAACAPLKAANWPEVGKPWRLSQAACSGVAASHNASPTSILSRCSVGSTARSAASVMPLCVLACCAGSRDDADSVVVVDMREAVPLPIDGTT